MQELRDYISHLMAEFRGQPDRLGAALEGLAKGALHQPVAAGEWSPHQIVAHVVSVDEGALLVRLRRIQEEDRPELPNWDGDEWMERSYDPAVDLSPLLAGWRQARAERADALEGAEMEVWNRVGIHPVQGERTLLWWLEYAVAHGQEHLEQLAG